MKIQNMAIIFLVIAIPLILILSYYLNLQQDTLKLQAEYDTKLASATKEGIKAFEINTVDWTEWVSEKTRTTERNDVSAAINTVLTSLGNNLNISGTAKEYMVNYIPAIAVTMYDGYYIYAPNCVPVTIENADGVQLYYDKDRDVLTIESKEGANLPAYKPKEGVSGDNAHYVYTSNDGAEIIGDEYEFVTAIENAKMEYKHTLSTQISYVERYKKSINTNVVVNYTLDNRIYVYGNMDVDADGIAESIEKDGYLVYFGRDTKLPRITIDPNIKNDTAISVINNLDEVIYNNGETETETKIETQIEAEILEEQVLYYDGSDYTLGTFKYVYDISHDKLYYDETEKNFFTIDSETRIRNFIPNNDSIKAGADSCKYKSVSLLLGDTEDTTEYKKIYQVLNGKDKGQWCISIKEDSDEAKDEGKEEIDTKISDSKISELGLTNNADTENICKDYSAISYYVEAYAFTNWIGDNLGDIKVEVEGTTENIFKITEINNPEKEGSPIVVHKEQVMKENIITNLKLSISNYSMGTYEFSVPVLTDNDWDQVFRNISIITFFQGMPIGLKYYNNYAIATSTTNREYVDPGEIYFSGADENLKDANYHRVYCTECEDINYKGYRSVEYSLNEYVKYDDTNSENVLPQKYYYQHDNQNDTNSETACYYCLVNRANYIQTDNKDIAYKQAKAYNEALARERYYQKQDIQARMNITITYHFNVDGWDDVTPVEGTLPVPQEVEIGSSAKISTLKPEINSSDPNLQYIFVGWAETPDSTTIKYIPGQTTEMIIEDKDIDLYAIWSISLSGEDWKTDFTPSISTITISEDKVEMVGNPSEPGKGAAWRTFTSDYAEIQEFSFDYSVNKGDSFNAAGFMFNIEETATQLKGYALSINFRGKFLNDAENKNGAIYKFEYTKGRNSYNVEKIELIQALPIGSYSGNRNDSGSGTIKIMVTETGYNITGTEFGKDASGNDISYDINVVARGDELRQNTFGFFSDHYSHGCSDIGYFKLNNIKVLVKRK